MKLFGFEFGKKKVVEEISSETTTIKETINSLTEHEQHLHSHWENTKEEFNSMSDELDKFHKTNLVRMTNLNKLIALNKDIHETNKGLNKQKMKFAQYVSLFETLEIKINKFLNQKEFSINLSHDETLLLERIKEKTLINNLIHFQTDFKTIKQDMDKNFEDLDTLSKEKEKIENFKNEILTKGKNIINMGGKFKQVGELLIGFANQIATTFKSYEDIVLETLDEGLIKDIRKKFTEYFVDIKQKVEKTNYVLKNIEKIMDSESSEKDDLKEDIKEITGKIRTKLLNESIDGSDINTFVSKFTSLINKVDNLIDKDLFSQKENDHWVHILKELALVKKDLNPLYEKTNNHLNNVIHFFKNIRAKKVSLRESLVNSKRYYTNKEVQDLVN